MITSAILLFGQGGKGEKPAPAAVATSGGLLSFEELERLINEDNGDYILVDVRTDAEYRNKAIPSAVNIPYDKIRNNAPTDDLSARIIVYCRSGRRSGIARKTLEEMGYTNVLDFGGLNRWQGETVQRN